LRTLDVASAMSRSAALRRLEPLHNARMAGLALQRCDSPPTSAKAYKVSRDKRKKVEMLFAHLKRILGLNRLRLRGPNGAKDEFLLAAIAQNLRKLAKLRPQCAISEAAA